MAKKKNEDQPEQMIEEVVDEKTEGITEDSAKEAEKEASTQTAFDETTATNEKLSELEKKRDEAVLIAQRLQADFDNYRKRNAKMRIEAVAEGEVNVIKAMLPIMDNFERAIACALEGSKEKPKEVSDFISGVNIILTQFTEALKKLGMEEIQAEGDFNPNLHEAVMQDEDESKASGTITAVLQKGYTVNGQVIRHTMVKVAK